MFSEAFVSMVCRFVSRRSVLSTFMCVVEDNGCFGQVVGLVHSTFVLLDHRYTWSVNLWTCQPIVDQIDSGLFMNPLWTVITLSESTGACVIALALLRLVPIMSMFGFNCTWHLLVLWVMDVLLIVFICIFNIVSIDVVV